MSQQLLDYVNRRAGDYLRGLATYDGTSVTLQATRDDLDRKEMEKRAREIRRAVRSRKSFRATSALGQVRASVQIRDEAVLLHFPIDDARGYLIGLEPEAARDLNEFVAECRTLIEDRQSFGF